MYEFKVVGSLKVRPKIENSAVGLEAYLNRMGREGWRVVPLLGAMDVREREKVIACQRT